MNRSSRRSINKTEAVPLGHCKVLGEMFVNVLSALRALARWPPLRLARPEICGFAMLFRQWPAWQGPEAWNRPFFSHGPQRNWKVLCYRYKRKHRASKEYGWKPPAAQEGCVQTMASAERPFQKAHLLR